MAEGESKGFKACFLECIVCVCVCVENYLLCVATNLI